MVEKKALFLKIGFEPKNLKERRKSLCKSILAQQSLRSFARASRRDRKSFLR